VPADKVVERIDEMSSRPDWLRESMPFIISDGLVVSQGQTEIPADHRLDAAFRVATNNAIAGMCGAIERKLEFIFQNSEEGTGLDSRQVRYIGAEATRLVASSIKPGKHYWEKVVHYSAAGAHQTKYRVFATVEMQEDEFKQAIMDALRHRAGKVGLSAEFVDKVDEQWDRLSSPERTAEAE
jgi:hypothetical protein